jgi:hypothetical protein
MLLGITELGLVQMTRKRTCRASSIPVSPAAVGCGRGAESPGDHLLRNIPRDSAYAKPVRIRQGTGVG